MNAQVPGRGSSCDHLNRSKLLLLVVMAPSTSSNVSRLSREHVVFDYLPGSQEDYAAVERRLIRRIDWTLMPVLISMIVLKCVHEPIPQSSFTLFFFLFFVYAESDTGS